MVEGCGKGGSSIHADTAVRCKDGLQWETSTKRGLS